MMFLSLTAVFVSVVAAGSLKDIDHVVLFMQENRAFDHYFGTMAGVRGFRDPNVQINPNDRSTFYQYVDSTLSNDTDYLMPFYAGYLGGNATEALQCSYGGDNGWDAMHEVYHGGLNDYWAVNNTPWSLMYLKRDDLPVQFELAEAYTVGDIYQQSVLAVTWPNRVFWQSGSIGVPGGPQAASEGGPLLTNADTIGCAQTDPNLNCLPLEWETFPEVLQNAGVSWQTYHNTTSYVPESLDLWANFQNITEGDPLYDRGLAYYSNNTLAAFVSAAEAGTLPQVSYVVAPQPLQEHPPYGPSDGGWLQRQVIEAVVNGKKGKTTAIIMSYDESGGWMDHVTPYTSPSGTAGEWMEDPYGELGYVFAGPGARVPFYIVSPWTRGGNVFTEHADHVSQLLFLEQWLQAKGYNVKTDQISTWRRDHMSNLVNAFDFDNPDYSIPVISSPAAPILGSDSTSTYQDYITETICAEQYDPLPVVPYGLQKSLYSDTSMYTEEGYKKVRGSLTEGRYLTFEASGYAVTNPENGLFVTATKATSDHESIKQRWILHQSDVDATSFTISSAADGKYITLLGTLSSSASAAHKFTFTDLGGSKGYTIKTLTGLYITLSARGVLSISVIPTTFSIYSVTYAS